MRSSKTPDDEPVARSHEDDSRDWVAVLRGPPAVREPALATLHTLLLRGARFELARRREALTPVPKAELDDLAVRASDHALVAILAKLDGFRGTSRFETWAYKFVLLEIGVEARRRTWQEREVGLVVELPEALGALRDAVEASLTPHERDVFAALALNGVPIDVLAERFGTTRGALYATLHEARRKLRAALVDGGARIGAQ
jgi:RNA polymerase sigma-70 factor (ECF subfamily)